MKEASSRKGLLLAILMRLLGLIALGALIWYLIVPNSYLYYVDGTFRPIFHRLNERDLIMTPGDKFKLRVQRINTRVSFSSLDIKVADVTPLGTVIAFRSGKTFIKAKYDDRELRCRVRVVKLNKKKIRLTKGERFDLDIEGPIIIKRTTWSSANSKVAKVNRFGNVSAFSEGKTVITGKIGGIKLDCIVIVSR